MTAAGGPKKVYEYEAYRIRLELWGACGGWPVDWSVTADPQATPGESGRAPATHGGRERARCKWRKTTEVRAPHFLGKKRASR